MDFRPISRQPNIAAMLWDNLGSYLMTACVRRYETKLVSLVCHNMQPSRRLSGLHPFLGYRRPGKDVSTTQGIYGLTVYTDHYGINATQKSNYNVTQYPIAS